MSLTTRQTRVSFEDTSVAFAAKSDGELQRVHWLFRAMNNPALVKVGTAAMRLALRGRLPVRGLIRGTIFAHFCGGENIEDCERTIRALGKYDIGTILDYSVEGEKTETAFDTTTQETLETIEKAASLRRFIPFSVFKVTGLADADLLAKVQRGEALTPAEQAAFGRVHARVDLICRRAHDLGVRVFVDGEESWIQQTIDALAYEMMEKYNRDQCVVYNTYQLYRHQSLNNLKTALERAEARGFLLGAKLVRGAYMEKESRRAAAQGYPDPIQPSKAATDRDFDAATRFCLDERPRISLCLGTHNEASSYLLVEEMRRRGIAPNDPQTWFAQLYGMSDNISYNLARAGYNVAKYVPYGPVAAVMPYLFRRAEENTSVAGQTSRELSLVQREVARRKKGARTDA